MENNCKYSDEWQPYIGDYDKYEYDIILKDGTIVENCYPNGGKFNSNSAEHDAQSFDEKEVDQIRFSQRPRFGINDGVSAANQDIPQNPHAQVNYPVVQPASEPFVIRNYNQPYHSGYVKGVEQVIRKEPKIGRNDTCSCGSGKKYKKCCLI